MINSGMLLGGSTEVKPLTMNMELREGVVWVNDYQAKFLELHITNNSTNMTVIHTRESSGNGHGSVEVTITENSTADLYYKHGDTQFYNGLSIGGSAIYSISNFINSPTLIKMSFHDLTNISYLPAVLPLSITDFNGFFTNCDFSGLATNRFPGWKFHNVSLYRMFNKCNLTNVILSTMDVSNVFNMNEMFRECNLSGLQIFNWNVSNVKFMVGMFYGSTNFNSFMSNWDVSNVTNMSNMFYDCETFNRDISNWDVSNVTNMSDMFYGCANFNIDISNWNTGLVAQMQNMFYGASIFNQNLTSWDISTIRYKPNGFDTYSALTESNNPLWEIPPGNGGGNTTAM